MASTALTIYGALAALLVWTAIGYPLARRLVVPTLALPFAPVIGWAVHNVVAVPVFFVLPFTSVTVIAVAAAVMVVGWAVSRAQGDIEPDDGLRVPAWTFGLAVVLAAVCAAAVLPKQVGDVFHLSDAIFDHSKAALVDDIARLGMPPGNPFFAHDGGSGRLAYYYLWHFSAAEVSRVLGLTGWEADAALTFVSAFMSLTVMMGLAVRLSGRATAAAWVAVFAAAASTRVLLVWLVGEPGLDAWIKNPGGFAGWFFQSAWVPQHLAGTSCVLVAVYGMTRLAARVDARTIVATALLVAAGFETSTWIGGVVFALASLAIVPVLLVGTEPRRRVRLLVALAAVAVVALLVAWPFVRDQMASSAQRQGSSPIALHPFPIVGERFPVGLRPWLDALAYWLVLLPIELMAIYLPGLAAMHWFRRRATTAPERRLVSTYVALVLASLVVGGWFMSTLADNNDLAWRAALLASTGLIVFAAAGLASWIAARRRGAVLLTLCAIALALPETARLADGYLRGRARDGMAEFANAPALWAAVRRETGPAERVANNPQSLERMTLWPVNIGWSLLADRRSCYATWELAQVYTAIPHDRLREIDRQFGRVFAGEATTADVHALATEFDCDVVVVTPGDGAWTRDPFRSGDVYRLVDDSPLWRIYRRLKAPQR